jgi:2-dehydropantoate 2-reductase
MKMKVAIYGAGAMGTVLGAFLARAGEKIDIITRNEVHYLLTAALMDFRQ